MNLLYLLITSGLALTTATGNSNDAIKLSTKRENVDLKNPRDKRSLGLAILFSSLLQNSAPPPPTQAPKMPMTTMPPPPQPLPPYIYNPSFGYQPHLPYVPDKNGYINFNVPDGYVLVTPPPPTPPPAPATNPPPALPLKLQKKQSFLNFLATLSAGVQPPPAPATTTMAPPQGILIPQNLYPNYQQQLRQRVIYKYAQNDDTLFETDQQDVAPPPYTYSATSDTDTATDDERPPYHDSNYHHEGPGPVDSSYYQSSHNAYEQQFNSTPDRFRISYPDDTETSQYHQEESQEAPKLSSQEQLQSSKEFSASYAYSTLVK